MSHTRTTWTLYPDQRQEGVTVVAGITGQQVSASCLRLLNEILGVSPQPDDVIELEGLNLGAVRSLEALEAGSEVLIVPGRPSFFGKAWMSPRAESVIVRSCM